MTCPGRHRGPPPAIFFTPPPPLVSFLLPPFVFLLARGHHREMNGGLVGKSAEFRDYSDSRPFELWNFHQNFIFPIVKCVLANLEHVPAGWESSPSIDSSNFMNRKMFPLCQWQVASNFETQRTNSFRVHHRHHTAHNNIYPIHTNL
jgi:hypothetical protein